MRSIADAYRAGDLPAFFRLTPDQLTIADAHTRPDVDRGRLVEALRAYHADLGTLDRFVEAQLARLADPAAMTVVTGQQAGLLGGPAYSVHKGADALLLARTLNREDRPVVGVYWVASQDHDADEVASVTVVDAGDEVRRLTLDLPRGVPVGRVPWRAAWTAEVVAFLNSLDVPDEHRARVLADVTWAAAGERSYADVFARLLHRTLGPSAERADGVLLFDPLHPALAALFVPALERELAQPTTGPACIEAAAGALERLGFTPQLRRPPGSTNLFLEGDDGVRRLLRAEGRAFVAERPYTREELLALVRAAPGRLTPAAGLRPILQDAVLPTAAFVVGPGEIAYGAQLREVYALHGLEQPLLWPRLSVTWLEPNVARLLTRFGVDAGAFQRDPEGSLGRALAREQGAHSVTQERLDAVRALFDATVADIAQLDPTLAGAATRTRDRSLARLARLQTQAARALARQENDRARQLTRLRAHLLPNGAPQEREAAYLTYTLKHGDAPQKLLLALTPGAHATLTIP